jgi:hypothetical protein
MSRLGPPLIEGMTALVQFLKYWSFHPFGTNIMPNSNQSQNPRPLEELRTQAA